MSVVCDAIECMPIMIYGKTRTAANSTQFSLTTYIQWRRHLVGAYIGKAGIM